MKIKALILGLVIAAATAFAFTATQDANDTLAIDKTKIKVPSKE